MYQNNDNSGSFQSRRPAGPSGTGRVRKPISGYGRKPKASSEKVMYYLTLLCPPEIDEQIAEHKALLKANYGCEVALKSPAHVTLIAPFFLSGGKYKELVERLNEFESIISDVNIDVNGYNHFGSRVIFADVIVNDNLVALQEQLENYLKNSGFPFIKEAKKPYHPHVTIATRDLKEKFFEDAWKNFEGKSFSSSFTTNTFHLMKLVNDKWMHDQQFVLK